MQKTPRIVWLILLAALVLRAGTAVVVDRHVKAVGRQFLIEGDANGYWELATRIAAGQDYCIHLPPRYVLRTPGFPLLLAVSIRVFGESIFAASLVLAVVGTCCVWLTWYLARSCFSESTAMLAAGIAAVSPLQIGNSVLILSETWFAFWLLLCLILLTRLLPQTLSRQHSELSELSTVENKKAVGSFRTACACGVLTGITVLVRPGWILWTGFSGLLVLLFGRGTVSHRLLLAVAVGVSCLVTLTPWAYRNYQITGHWVFTSLWSGPSLYDGLHPDADGASDMSFVDDEPIYATMSEFDANSHYKQRAAEFVMQNPWRTTELAVLKAGRFLSLTPNATGFNGGLLSLICLAFNSVFFLLTACGAWIERRRPAVLALLLLPFLQFLLVHMVFVGSIRYRLPVEFPLMALAAVGVIALFRGRRKPE